MIKITLSMNTIVEVHLTEEGRKIYRKHVGSSQPVDEVLETELWTLMEIFGPHITHAGEIFFKNNEITFPVTR